MSDTKTSLLTALAGVNTASNDILPIVDTSATTTKSITVAELRSAMVGLITTRHVDGTVAAYIPSADTDAARYTALAAALAAAVAGDHILVGPGDYAVTATLALPSGVTLRGSGYGTRLYIAASVSGSNLNVITNADTTNGNSGIVVEGFYIDGNNANVTSGRQQGITFTKVSEFTIRGNWIKHLGRAATASCIAISPIGCTDGIITGNVMDDTVDGFNPGTAATPSYRLTVSNNVVLGTNRDYPFNLFWIQNSTIVGNVVKSSAKSAFNCQTGCVNNIISNNVVYGTTSENCITLGGSGTPASNNTIMGNHLRGGAINAIGDGGTGNMVAFNDCRGGGVTEDIPDTAGTANYYFANMQTNGTVHTTGVPAF